MNLRSLFLVISLLCAPVAARAHVSEQGFVLLLPTGAYIAAGTVTVFATVVLMALVPAVGMRRVFGAVRLPVPGLHAARRLCLFLSFLLFVFMVSEGWTGSRDPLKNALPLGFWTVIWIGVVSVQGAVFDIWRWINPLAWPAQQVARISGGGVLRLPERGAGFAGCALFLLFGAFLLADPAPADPARLAAVVAGYCALTLGAVALFGRRWMVRGEVFTVLMRVYRGVTPLAARRAGLWGWRAARGRAPTLAIAVFIALLLGTGSFDGLNETFLWLGVLGVNPLEFPGRSAVVVPTIAGLLVLNAALVAAYAVCIWLGLRLAGGGVKMREAFRVFSPSLLPIALAYHIAHYLTSFLVDIQYVRALIQSATGAGQSHVTTGFFNTLGTVRIIWLTQGGVVVLGHVIAILLAHALALRLYGGRREAVLSQAPLAVAMVVYTIFGLWLLAAPRGA